MFEDFVNSFAHALYSSAWLFLMYDLRGQLIRLLMVSFLKCWDCLLLRSPECVYTKTILLLSVSVKSGRIFTSWLCTWLSNILPLFTSISKNNNLLIVSLNVTALFSQANLGVTQANQCACGSYFTGFWTSRHLVFSILPHDHVLCIFFIIRGQLGGN